MKELIIPHAGFTDSRPSLAILPEFIRSHLPLFKIDSVCWRQFPEKPEVTCRAGWWDQEILLQFRVKEKTSRASFTEPNSPVYKDSCVEFFIESGDGNYFNFECNPIGTCYLGRGTGRADTGPIARVNMVRSIPSLEKVPFHEEVKEPWELTLVLPLEIFKATPLASPGGKTFKANFYKCGENLTTKHYLCWNPIISDKPDFHHPKQFGSLFFNPE